MGKTDILLRVVENLLDENKRLRQELDDIKNDKNYYSAIPEKYDVKRSRIVNDQTDMIQEYHELIEQFEKERVKDRMKHKFEKAGFVAGGEKIVPKPETHFEKTCKLMSEFWKLQADFKQYQESKKESKS
jgi:hypothetical protein